MPLTESDPADIDALRARVSDAAGRAGRAPALTGCVVGRRQTPTRRNVVDPVTAWYTARNRSRCSSLQHHRRVHSDDRPLGRLADRAEAELPPTVDVAEMTQRCEVNTAGCVASVRISAGPSITAPPAPRPHPCRAWRRRARGAGGGAAVRRAVHRGVDHTAVHLGHAAPQLGHRGQHVKQFGRTRSQTSDRESDDVKLLLPLYARGVSLTIRRRNWRSVSRCSPGVEACKPEIIGGIGNLHRPRRVRVAANS